MHEIYRRRKNQKMLYSWPVLLLAFVVAVVFSRSAWRVYMKKVASERELVKVMEEERGLSERERTLQAKIDRLQTPEGVEAAILEKYNVARAGESVAIIVDSVSDTDETSSESEGILKKTWQKIKGWFD